MAFVSGLLGALDVTTIARWSMNKSNHYIKIKKARSAKTEPLFSCSLSSALFHWALKQKGRHRVFVGRTQNHHTEPSSWDTDSHPSWGSGWSKTKPRMSWGNASHLSLVKKTRLVFEENRGLVEAGIRPQPWPLAMSFNGLVFGKLPDGKHTLKLYHQLGSLLAFSLYNFS